MVSATGMDRLGFPVAMHSLTGIDAVPTHQYNVGRGAKSSGSRRQADPALTVEDRVHDSPPAPVSGRKGPHEHWCAPDRTDIALAADSGSCNAGIAGPR